MSIDNSPPAGHPQHPDSHRSIIRSTSILSVGTFSSRILGFIRDILLATIMGTGFRADAFFVALKIPNLFRDLVGEGATNSAVVPVFSEYLLKKDKAEFWRFVSVILMLAVILLAGLTLIGVWLAPWIVRLIAPGFMADAGKLDLTIQLTRMMFPYLIFIGLTAYSMAILFTFRSFTVPAFTPCLLNVSMITCALLAIYNGYDPVFVLAIGVLAGGLLQLLLQIGPLAKTGMRFHWPRTLRHPGAIQVGKLLIPRLFGAGVYQLTVLIDTFFASLAVIIGAGGISAIYYSNRIIQFPMGVFGVALASAVLPTLSGFATNNEMDKLKKTLVFAVENIFFIMFPTGVMLFLLSEPIIRVLFERGQFDAYSTQITSSALLFYAIGLFSFGGIKILVTAFHALQDTKTPVKVAAGCLIVNAALSYLLMFPLKVGGIALASSIAATVDFLVLFWLMDRRLGGLNSGLRLFVFKVLLASVATGFAVNACWNALLLDNEVVRLAAIGLGGFVVYGVLCYVLRIEQAHKIYQWIRTFGKK